MGKPNCTVRALKTVLFALHLVFAITGLLLIAYGAVRCVLPDRTFGSTEDTTLDRFEAPRYTVDVTRYGAFCFIIVGVIIIHIGCIGCYLATREHPTYFLCRYTLFLAATLLMQLFLVGIAFGLHFLVVTNLEESMSNSMTNIYGFTNSSKTGDWDSMQSKLGCCGLTDPSDWSNTWWYNQTGHTENSVPLSCCPVFNMTQTPKNLTACNAAAYSRNATDRDSFIHTKGCSTTMKEMYVYIVREMFFVAVFILAVQTLVVMVTTGIHVCVNKAYVTVYGDVTGVQRPLLDGDESQQDTSVSVEHQAEVHREASPTQDLLAAPTDVVVHPVPVSAAVVTQTLSTVAPLSVQAGSQPASRGPSPNLVAGVQSQTVTEAASLPLPPSEGGSRLSSRGPSPVPAPEVPSLAATLGESQPLPIPQEGSRPTSRGPSPNQVAGANVSPLRQGSQSVAAESLPLPAEVVAEAQGQSVAPSHDGSEPTPRAASPAAVGEAAPAQDAAVSNLSPARHGSQPTSRQTTPTQAEHKSPGVSAKPASRLSSPKSSPPVSPENSGKATSSGVSSGESGKAASPLVSPGGSVKSRTSPAVSPSGSARVGSPKVSPGNSAKPASPLVSPGGSAKAASPRMSPGGSVKPASRASSPNHGELEDSNPAATDEFSVASEDMN